MDVMRGEAIDYRHRVGGTDIVHECTRAQAVRFSLVHAHCNMASITVIQSRQQTNIQEGCCENRALRLQPIT